MDNVSSTRFIPTIAPPAKQCVDLDPNKHKKPFLVTALPAAVQLHLPTSSPPPEFIHILIIVRLHVHGNNNVSFYNIQHQLSCIARDI